MAARLDTQAKVIVAVFRITKAKGELGFPEIFNQDEVIEYVEDFWSRRDEELFRRVLDEMLYDPDDMLRCHGNRLTAS